jgi:hypothetical protein
MDLSRCFSCRNDGQDWDEGGGGGGRVDEEEDEVRIKVCPELPVLLRSAGDVGESDSDLALLFLVLQTKGF